MSLSNPTFDKLPLGRSRADHSQQLKAQIQRTRELVRGLESFVMEEHLSPEVFRAFWRHEERAVLTLRAMGQTLEMDLAEVARSVHEHLEMTAGMELVDFQVSEAAYLFSLIDSIEPGEVRVGDGRVAAEKFQYAVEARTALLRYVLHVLIQRYSPTFQDATLADTRAWLQAFLDLLEEAKQVVQGTQQLLWDEATSIQSYLDTLENRFALYREQARAAAILVREDWGALIQETEARLLDHLERRQEQLDKLAVGELGEPWERGWLATVALRTARHAPLVGSLLLSLSGMKSMHAAAETPRVAPRLPDLAASIGEGVEQVAERVQSFPVLARLHSLGSGEAPRENDEVAQFFRAGQGARGRQTLTIADSTVFHRVLGELSRFGYPRRDVLRLSGMNSVSDLTSPLTMEIRWGQGGRPLLLPPYEAPAPLPSPQETHVVRPGAPLALIAQRFGFTEEQILGENPGLVDAGSVTEGQVIALPAVEGWTQQRNGSGKAIGWGATLEQIARELSVSAHTLADINDIPNPDSWVYEGQSLLVPAAPADGVTDQETAQLAAPLPLEQVQFVGEKKPVHSLIVHYLADGETLDEVAERYQTTVSRLLEDNQFASGSPAAGDLVLVRVGGRVVQLLPGSEHPGAVTPQYDAPEIASAGGFPAPYDAPHLESGGSFAPSQPAADSGVGWEGLVAQYGTTMYPSLAEMPEDLRLYFATTVQEIADFFNVRPGDIIGILQAENNNAGLRVYQPAVSSAGARGVAQVVARTWNGWANPHRDSHLTDLLSIEQHGGLGFDWSAREAWLEWKEGRSDGSALASANADPERFDNSVAAIARHLVHWGLTRDHAQNDPEWFRQRLGDAISVYNSGRPLAEAMNFRQSAENGKTTGQYVQEAIALAEATPLSLIELAAEAPPANTPLRDAYVRLMDRTLAMGVSEEALARVVDHSPVAEDVQAGRLSVEEGARQLWQEVVRAYIAAGAAARAEGRPLPWPYVYDARSLSVQQVAFQLLGHPLSEAELDEALASTGGDEQALRTALAARPDARLFASALRAFDESLQRSARHLPTHRHEVAAVVLPALAGLDPRAMDEAQLEAAMARVEQAIRALPEYQRLHSEGQFTAMPLQPMPQVIRGFGAPVDYQQGGKHTGVDLANPAVNGQEPALYAMAAGTVVHVGPLYCEAENACRGDHAIVIDHGNMVYSIYSHNSEATVREGEQVQAGQPIGRQGDEGYSFGSHLHLEVHTGAPFSGDWQNPWPGGQFEDPMAWLP